MTVSKTALAGLVKLKTLRDTTVLTDWTKAEQIEATWSGEV